LCHDAKTGHPAAAAVVGLRGVEMQDRAVFGVDDPTALVVGSLIEFAEAKAALSGFVGDTRVFLDGVSAVVDLRGRRTVEGKRWSVNTDGSICLTESRD